MDVEFFLKLFLRLLRWSYFFGSNFLFFYLLMWCIKLIDLQILIYPCLSGINPNWSWCMILLGFPGCSVGKESACNARNPGSIPGWGRFPWRRKWQPTPKFLPGEFHGQRSLVGYSPWDHKESDTTEWLNWTELRNNNVSCSVGFDSLQLHGL